MKSSLVYNDLNKISKSIFINLKRRKDRLYHLQNTLPFPAEKFDAIDHENLNINEEVKSIFKSGLNKLSTPEIACFLSHYKIWENLINDDSSDNYLILEDDVVFDPTFFNYWQDECSKNLPNNYSLIFLGGCQPWNLKKYPEVLSSYNKYFNNIKKNDFFTKDDYYWHMSAQSYIITKKAAQSIIDYIKVNGVNRALDIFLINFFNKENSKKLLHLNPLLTSQLHEQGGSIEIDSNSDIRNIETKVKFSFPFIKNLTINEIPKKIHISWKDKDILSSSEPLITRGLKNLQKLNPEWDIIINDDEDVEKYLRDYLPIDDYNLIKNKRIVEKTDLWRVMKVYNEGGLYLDIDKYCNISLSEIIKDKTQCVLPTYLDTDFSQDFVLSVPKNPIQGAAIKNNIHYRRKGHNLFFLAVQSYMHSVTEVLSGRKIDRDPPIKYFNDIRSKINDCPYIETYRESPPYDTILYRPESKINFDYEEDKASFYNSYDVTHWNSDTQSSHNLKLKQNQFLQMKNLWPSFINSDFLNYIKNNLPERKSINQDLSIYNPNNKIAIVSLYTKEIKDYALESEYNISSYAKKHGYTFYVYRKNLNNNFSPNWSKAEAIMNLINDHDYIVWMDSDTLIFNPNKTFESIIGECSKRTQLMACEDVGKKSMINNGVMIIKNHNYMKNILKNWKDYSGDKSSLYSDGGDQEVLCDILKKADGFNFNTRIFPMKSFNTDPRMVEKDTFILHFMAYTKELKVPFMKYWNSF